MIPLAEPDLSGNEAAYLQECIASNYVSSVGPFVERFEALIAQSAGTATAVATCSGTAGLHVALVAIGVGPGDLVVTPAYSFIATANAVAVAGADPWFVDISPASWTLDPEALNAAFARDVVRNGNVAIHRPSGRRVAAILPVHTLGHPADLEAIALVARRYGVPIVADAAAAIGASYRGKPIGAAGADLSVFSFNGNKTITSGGGGAVVGLDSAVVKRVRHLSATARAGTAYQHDAVAFNYRMTNLQAAVGCAQMERLGPIMAAKRGVRARYVAGLAGLNGASVPPAAPWAESAFWINGFELAAASDARRAATVDRLRKDGIDAREFWQPLHRQQPYRGALAETLMISERLATGFIALPSSSNLSAGDQDRVIAACRRAVAG